MSVKDHRSFVPYEANEPRQAKNVREPRDAGDGLCIDVGIVKLPKQPVKPRFIVMKDHCPPQVAIEPPYGLQHHLLSTAKLTGVSEVNYCLGHEPALRAIRSPSQLIDASGT
jgi:hypothetical protein